MEPTRLSDNVKLIAASLAGALGGGVVSVLVARSLLLPAAPQAERSPVAIPSTRAPGLGTAAQRVSDPAVLARLGQLEQQLLAKSVQGAPEPAGAELPRFPSAEEASADAIARQREQLANHEKDPVDPTWSRAATAAFEKDFATIATTTSARLLRMDCRTTSCLAVVGWPSYGEALAHGAELAHHEYGINCSRHVVSPPPADPALPYESTVAFECTSARAE